MKESAVEIVFEDESGVDTEALALKRSIAMQIAREMKRGKLTKTEMAQRMQTSRTSLERLLDPSNVSITLQTLHKAASALGKTLKIAIS